MGLASFYIALLHRAYMLQLHYLQKVQNKVSSVSPRMLLHTSSFPLLNTPLHLHKIWQAKVGRHTHPLLLHHDVLPAGLVRILNLTSPSQYLTSCAYFNPKPASLSSPYTSRFGKSPTIYSLKISPSSWVRYVVVLVSITSGRAMRRNR